MVKDMAFLFLSLPFAVISARSVWEGRRPRTSTAGGLGRDEGTTTLPGARIHPIVHIRSRVEATACLHPPPSKPGSHRPCASSNCLLRILDEGGFCWDGGEKPCPPPSTATLPSLGAPRTRSSRFGGSSLVTPRISHHALAADPNGPDSQGRLSDDVLGCPAHDEAVAAGCSRTTKALDIVRVCGSVDSDALNTGLRVRTSMGSGLVVDTDDEGVHVARWTDARGPPGPACLATSAKQENSSHLPCSPLRMVVCGSCTGRVWPRKDRCTCCRRRCTACWMRECSSSQGSGDFHDGRAAGRHPHPPNPPNPLHPFSNKLQSTSLHPPNHLQTLWPLHRANPAAPSMLIDPDAPVRRSSTDRGLSWWGFRGLALESQIWSPAPSRPRHDLHLALLRPTPMPNGDFRP